MAVSRVDMAGRNDAVESCKRLRSQRRECQCAVDLASSPPYAQPFCRLPMPDTTASRKRPRVEETDPASLRRRRVRMTKQMAVEKRLRCACAELRAWMNVAVARDAENAALRGELDHALRGRAGWPDEDDAESFCGDNFTGGGKEEDEGGGGPSTAARCFGCGEHVGVPGGKMDDVESSYK
ncbi:hypothetical protein E2562_008070 [Oryza meyeriana var. granulata]|uniref:Uncharacterized protein n=1 Tax=Oryza meyeriana var. granulata TaxID=110450 RepID=A0A6G1DFY2_9ORYZ|nr:hypothetical protein E2562_008070 [Oryza meyeriana var. granulata]